MGIAVVNTPGRNAAAVADMVVALFVGMSRFLFLGERILRAGQWDEDLYYRLRGREMFGSTVALVGFGAISRELVTRLSGFGMKLIAYDPYVTAEEMAAHQVEKVTLEEAFSQGDFITVHVPVTKSTTGMVDKRLLSCMKPTAYFVNAARAAIVQEEDLVDSLKAHRIAGAALDVYAQEPLPLEHPLLALDNVVLIPHLGGASLDVVNNHSRMIVADIAKYCTKQRPARLVNTAVME